MVIIFFLPVCLIKPTTIEISMISIFCPVTKLAPACSKFYQAHPIPTTFSCYNDLTKVFQSLPHIPTSDEVAVLRHHGAVRNLDHSYRPYYIKKALDFLIKNNVAYKDIVVEWPEEIMQHLEDKNSVLQAECFSIDEEDLRAIDDTRTNQPSESVPSTNPGYL